METELVWHCETLHGNNKEILRKYHLAIVEINKKLVTTSEFAC